jgi:hypothetical protein
MIADAKTMDDIVATIEASKREVKAAMRPLVPKRQAVAPPHRRRRRRWLRMLCASYPSLKVRLMTSGCTSDCPLIGRRWTARPLIASDCN